MVDDEKPVVIMGSSSSARTMADGTLRVAIDILPNDAVRAFELFGSPGSAVALARLKDEVAVEEERPKAETLYGKMAQELKLSSFFRTLEVWEAIGSDGEYLEWVRGQPSAINGAIDHGQDSYGNTITRNVAAHVRHIEHGSGTGIKPPYSAIPLCQYQHDHSHQKGDSVIGGRDWWAKMRIKYVSDWCWETGKKQIQARNTDIDCSSWSMIPPQLVVDWAVDLGIVKHLPFSYISETTNVEGLDSIESSAEGQTGC